MTDELLDELVSAVIDGEAAPDEVDRVQRDPQLRRRAEQLRAAKAAVAAPVTFDDETRDRTIAQAVAELPPPPVIVDFTAEKQSRRPVLQLLAAAVGGAAAASIVAVALVATTGSDDSGDVQFASEPASVAVAESQDAADTAAAPDVETQSSPPEAGARAAAEETQSFASEPNYEGDGPYEEEGAADGGEAAFNDELCPGLRDSETRQRAAGQFTTRAELLVGGQIMVLEVTELPATAEDPAELYIAIVKPPPDCSQVFAGVVPINDEPTR